jgi:hypothetical protein
MCQLLATLCVALSLTLFTLGGANPTDRFCLRTLSYCRPMAIVGPVLDTIAISYDVADTSCKKLGWLVNMCLLHPFTAPVRACHFTSSVVTAWGYKAGGRPCVNLHPFA